MARNRSNVTAKRFSREALRLNRLRHNVTLHQINCLAQLYESSSILRVGSNNSPTVRSATDKDKIRRYVGHRRRWFIEIDEASTRRLVVTVTTANKLKSPAIMISSTFN